MSTTPEAREIIRGSEESFGVKLPDELINMNNPLLTNDGHGR